MGCGSSKEAAVSDPHDGGAEDEVPLLEEAGKTASHHARQHDESWVPANPSASQHEMKVVTLQVQACHEYPIDTD